MEHESFVNFLDDYGAACPPKMVYRQGEDFVAWQQRLRRALETLRGPLPDRAALDVDVVESADAGDHTRLLLRIAVSEFSSLPAYLLLPKGLTAGEKRPGLVVLHGHHPHGMDNMVGLADMDDPQYSREPFALFAVRLGYVVLAPAWWGWTGRDGHLDLVGQRDRCNAIQTAAAMYGMNVLSLHIQDGQAALDVLSARPEVDAERIGCIGHSYGGRMSMWLAVFDERVKAVCMSGSMNTFRERSLKLASCGIQYLPGLLQVADVQEVLSLIAPRPMQLQAGKLDPLITPADRDAIRATVAEAYRRLAAESDFHYELHGEGHIAIWELAEPFLTRYLGKIETK